MISPIAYTFFELHVPWRPAVTSLLLDWFKGGLYSPGGLTPIPYGYSLLHSGRTLLVDVVATIDLLKEEPIPFSMYMGLYDEDIRELNIAGSMEYRHYLYTPYGDPITTRGFCFQSDPELPDHVKPSFEGQEDNLKAYKLKQLLNS